MGFCEPYGGKGMEAEAISAGTGHFEHILNDSLRTPHAFCMLSWFNQSYLSTSRKGPKCYLCAELQTIHQGVYLYCLREASSCLQSVLGKICHGAHGKYRFPSSYTEPVPLEWFRYLWLRYLTLYNSKTGLLGKQIPEISA